MFEIGKNYTIITTWEVGENGGMSTEHPNCEAIEIELPIVKFRQHEKEWTINISSPVFAGAQARMSWANGQIRGIMHLT